MGGQKALAAAEMHRELARNAVAAVLAGNEEEVAPATRRRGCARYHESSGSSRNTRLVPSLQLLCRLVK